MARSKTPPVVIRFIQTPQSALEYLITDNELTSNLQHIEKFTSKDAGFNVVETNDYEIDAFVLSQYLIYLYINIFVFKETSFVYKDLIAAGVKSLSNNLDAIKDIKLKEIISIYITPESIRNDFAFQKLESVILRVRPENTYPGLKNIIALVRAAYSSRIVKYDTPIAFYSVVLHELPEYDGPSFVLSPAGFSLSIDTTGVVNIPSLFWKLVYGLKLSDILSEPGDVTFIFLSLAKLALPLDPSSLTLQMRQSLYTDSKAGIPFLNYLAMFLRQTELGISYTLSRMADPRRILMKRLHQFCGIGGTYISDNKYSKPIIEALFNYKTKNFSKDDYFILSILTKGEDDSTVSFTKKLYYNYDAKPTTDIAFEAVSTKTPKTPPTTTGDDTDDTTDDGSFSDDAPPDDTDTTNSDTQTTQQADDNNIDRTSDVGQDFAAANAKAFIPLALPTETIDDYLLRVAVMKYVQAVDKDPTPDITPENLEKLKYWCCSWLFIASIDLTKTLLAKLNITGQLKEFTI